MAQHSGFFTALNNAGEYDRTYTAEDYSSNLAVVISNGVLRSNNDDLNVTASGLNLSVNLGRAWIKGCWFYNDSAYNLPAVVPPTGGKRIDRVVLRYDNTIAVRSISIQYLQGVASTSPVPAPMTRTDDIYDICLAEITVNQNAVSVGVKDTRSNSNLCGWVYSVSGDNSFFTSLDNEFNTWFDETKDTLSSVTLFKQYRWSTTLSSSTNIVAFNVPQYDPETCFFNVFINGLYSTDYAANNNTITFTTTLSAGTDIDVLVYKSIDGTGIMSVSDEITQLQNEYATLDGVSKLVYKATGRNDNVALSEIAQAIFAGSYDPTQVSAATNDFFTALGGNTWLASLYDYSQITIEVVGKLHVSTPAYGSGTVSSRYRYFNFSQIQHSDRRITFDFARAETIEIAPSADTNNIIFYGTDLNIRNASVDVEGDGGNCNISMIIGSQAGDINAENCRFDLMGSGDLKIAEQGTFINCDCRVRSEAGNSFVFNPKSANLIRVIGGRHLAYAMVSGKTAAVFYTPSTETNAVIMATNINCPTVSESGYWQQYLSLAYAGNTVIDCVISTMNSGGGQNTITNQIWKSKTW